MVRDPLIGTLIADRFEVRSKIGQGGMGAVYRAFQRSVKREVAIKVIRPQLVRNPRVVKLFEREAELASKLSQPNTVSIFDYGQIEDGTLFIAMELLVGRTLLEVLNGDGIFSVDRAVRVGSQLCDALEAAHALGIVHRDLKLENVIVLDKPEGRDLLKVLDFGLARLFDDQAASSATAAVGTPRYMAPEVALKGKTSPASDVYAVGVMLGELTTGGPLWTTDSLGELVELKQRPQSAVALVPPLLQRAVAALLEPNPDKRPNAAQARTLLRTIADGSVAFPPSRVPSVEQTAPVVRRRSIVRWPFVMLLLLAAAAAAYWQAGMPFGP